MSRQKREKIHPLKQYLIDTNTLQVDFAERMGVSPQQLSDVLRGKTSFGPENTLQAVAATGGVVGPEAFLSFRNSR